jgi:hypothetical protein
LSISAVRQGRVGLFVLTREERTALSGVTNISKTGPLNRRSLRFGRDDKGRGSAFRGEWLAVAAWVIFMKRGQECSERLIFLTSLLLHNHLETECIPHTMWAPLYLPGKL